MGYTTLNRFARGLCVNVLALFVIILAFIGIFQFQDITDILNDKFVISDDCDFSNVNKTLAH